jgi:hypothetical protein
MRKINLFFGVIFFCALLISPSLGAEVRIDGGKIIVFGVDDSLGLSAFNVVLEYGASTRIDSIEGVDPYFLIPNIENEKGIARIAGYSTDFSGTYPKGDIEIARIAMNGSGVKEIYVNELVNDRGDAIPCSNPRFSGDGSSEPGSSSPSKDVPSMDADTTDGTLPSSSGSVSDKSQSSVLPSSSDENSDVSLSGENTSEAGSGNQSGIMSDKTEKTESINGNGSGDQSEKPVQKSPIFILLVLFALFIGCAVYRRFH